MSDDEQIIVKPTKYEAEFVKDNGDGTFNIRFVERWRFSFIAQRPTIGSKWYRGNFTLGLSVDSHPRFFNVILCLLFVEVGFGWEKR